MKNKTLVALLLVVAMVLAGAAAFAADTTTPITATKVSEAYVIADKQYYDITVPDRTEPYIGCILSQSYPATCAADAYSVFLAEDESGLYNIPIKLVYAGSKDAHIAKNKAGYTTDKNAPATCDKAGLKGYEFCPVCNVVVNAGEVIPALGHKYDTVGTIVKAPGFFTKGTIVYFCTVEGCDAYDPAKVEEVLPKLGYEYVTEFITYMYKIITNLMYSDWVIL